MSPTEQGKLSKEEVEALLHATMEGEATPERSQPARRVQGYDFLQPSRFSRAALDKLRSINENLAAQSAGFVSHFFRGNVKTQLASIDQMKWEHLIDEAGESLLAFVLTMAPLGHKGIAALDVAFASRALETMMGGKSGDDDEPGGDFSEVDVAVLRRFVAGFLAPLPELWERIGQFQVEIGPFVQDLGSLELFPSGEDFFQLCFLMQTGSGSGQIVLSVPFEAVRQLPLEGEEEETGVPEAPEADRAAQEAIRENIGSVDVELTVLLGNADIKVSQLVNAAPGDVIMLDTRLGDPVQVAIGGKAKLRGFPGVASGKYAVKIVVEG
jgi:flagellar motor switch protein FliM